MGSTKKKYHKLVSAIKNRNYHEFMHYWNDKFDLKYVDSEGRTLLHWATDFRTVNIARFLVARGAKLETEDTESATPLSLAVSLGDRELVTLYLDKGANPNGVNRAVVPLVLAADYGQDAMISLLLERGVDVNIVDEDGDTPLMAAAMKGRYFAAKTLLENGARTQIDVVQIESSDYPHWVGSPLHWAVQEEFPEIVQLLLDYGADVEAVDEIGLTPLSTAVDDDTSILEMLLEKATNINGSATIQSPLSVAVSNHYHRAAALLIARGADVNLVDHVGSTLLATATSLRAPRMMQLLLDAGADTNIANEFGDTPLFLATYYRELPLMKLLLDAGADTSLTNDNGETALEAAKAGKFKKGVALLKSYAKA